MLDNEFRVRVA